MKDKQGFEMSIDDQVRLDNGMVRRVLSLDGGRAVLACDIADAPLIQQFHGENMIILRRADGSVPERCGCCTASLRSSPLAHLCACCHGTGSIDRKPARNCDGCGAPGANHEGLVRGKPGVICAKCAARCVYPVQAGTAVDKHGREVRAGDLYRTANGVVQRTLKEVAEWAHQHVAAWARCEIIARGNPSDPVPEGFEPKRDAEGRPVLDEILEVETGPCVTLNLAPVRRDLPACRDRRWIEEGREKNYAAMVAKAKQIVAELAPLAPLVTDRVMGTAERAESLLTSFRGEPKESDKAWPLTMPFERFETEFRGVLREYLVTVGARQMGGGR